MSSTLRRAPLIANSDRAYAAHLLETRRELIDAAWQEHQDGWHVGTNLDYCSDCPRGDIPRVVGIGAHPSRAEYLERNIAEAVDRMRLHADLAALSFGI
jgi:hypothetical protein